MHQIRFPLFPLVSLLLCINGCQATRTASRKVGQAVVAIPLFIAEGLINSVLDSDETLIEQDRRERTDRQWKQHWRDHPNDNPAMHEAFKDDYE